MGECSVLRHGALWRTWCLRGRKPLATHLMVAAVLVGGDKQAQEEQWPILFLQGRVSWARPIRQGAILVTFQEGYE